MDSPQYILMGGLSAIVVAGEGGIREVSGDLRFRNEEALIKLCYSCQFSSITFEWCGGYCRFVRWEARGVRL